MIGQSKISVFELLWLEKPVFWLLALEFLVDDLERIWDRVVVTIKRAEGGQNLIIYAFHQYYFLKGVKTMDLSDIIFAELWLW